MGVSQEHIDAAMQQQQTQGGGLGSGSGTGLNIGSMQNLTPAQMRQLTGTGSGSMPAPDDESMQERSALQDLRTNGLRTVSGTNLELMLFEQLLIDSLAQARDTIRIFGQEIFSNKNLTFTPNYNMATPRGYVLAAGDQVVIEVWGAAEMNLRRTIGTEGSVYLEGIGPVQLTGYTIEEAEASIRSRLASIIGGVGSDTHVKVSLGQIRSIRVNVLGEVLTPGTYTLPSLATLFNALYLAGGVSDIGSLRNIQVFRDNKLAATLDVYDYLIHGRTEANLRLQDNDMIIVPPYDALVWASGYVKREMGYEMRAGETVDDLLLYAGGFRGDAYTDDLLVKRTSGSRFQVFTVDAADFGHFALNDGDSVKVGRIIDRYENRLQIDGAVWRPGEYEYSERLDRLSELIAKAGGVTGDQYADRGQITRQRADFTDEMLPFNLRDVLSGAADISLQPEDRVYIPTIEEMTETYYILVRGEVNRPDTIPFRYNMNIEDAVLLAGGLKESASMANVEISRRIRSPRSTDYSPQIAQTYHFPITDGLAVSPEGAAFTLLPFDEVDVRRSPAYMPQERVTIDGEILFGGQYAFSRAGERLSEVVAKAGGVTPEAYVRGASLVRRMTDDEQARVDAKLAMAVDLVGLDTVGMASRLNDTYSVGIDLERAMRNPGGPDDIVLRDGDAIRIPKLNNTVKISGSVLMTNTVTFEGSRVRDYIDQAGGYTQFARRRPYVVYMSGKVASTRVGFLHRRFPRVEPGCEIIVPERIERTGRMRLGEWVGLLSSTALTTATVSSLLK